MIHLSLNNGGTDPQNPILSGIRLKATLYKHNEDETLRKCWVQADGEVFYNVTSSVNESATFMVVNLVAGTQLKSDTTPKRNVIHFTTSGHRHARGVVWVVDLPDTMITLDGYDARSWERPFIYPVYIDV